MKNKIRKILEKMQSEFLFASSLRKFKFNVFVLKFHSGYGFHRWVFLLMQFISCKGPRTYCAL